MSMIAADVVSILTTIGVQVHRVNSKGEINALCPEHEERTGRPDRHPDWWMNGTTGAYICFSCQARGSLYQLLAKFGTDDMDLVEIRTQLQAAMPLGWSVDDEPAEEEEPEEDPVYEWWFDHLDYPGPGLLRIRHLTLDALKLHDVRFDHTNHCWVIPIREPFTGRLLGVQNKAKGWFRNRPDNVPKSKTLFGWQVFTGKRVILVESPLDAVRIESAGVSGAVATYGSWVSDEQLDLLTQRHVGIETVVLAFDRDQAGRQSRDDVKERLRRRWIVDVRAVPYKHFGDAKDLGEVADDETVRYIIDHAQ